ncbi:MAG: ABC transporter permease, partial [Hyphomicrobiales bacterium]
MMRLPARIALFVLVAAGPVIFVIAPIGAFLVMSFWRVEGHEIVPDTTLLNYAGFFGNWTYFKTFLLTLWLCAQVTLIGVLLGYPIAWFIWKRRQRSRYPLLLLFVMPLFMSYIVKIYTMRSILGLNGFLNQILVSTGLLSAPSLVFLYNQTAILITMAVIFLPFVILPIFL